MCAFGDRLRDSWSVNARRPIELSGTFLKYRETSPQNGGRFKTQASTKRLRRIPIDPFTWMTLLFPPHLLETYVRLNVLGVPLFSSATCRTRHHTWPQVNLALQFNEKNKVLLFYTLLSQSWGHFKISFSMFFGAREAFNGEKLISPLKDNGKHEH